VENKNRNMGLSPKKKSFLFLMRTSNSTIHTTASTENESDQFGF
jgi:hypothetical protein